MVTIASAVLVLAAGCVGPGGNEATAEIPEDIRDRPHRPGHDGRDHADGDEDEDAGQWGGPWSPPSSSDGSHDGSEPEPGDDGSDPVTPGDDGSEPETPGDDGSDPVRPGDGGNEPVTPGDDGGNQGGGSANADSVWTHLSVMQVVNPMDHGAAGNGSTNDLGALNAAVNALPREGGIVYLPEGRSFRKNDLLVITKDHVKFWAPNRSAELYQTVGGQRRKQSVLCRNNTGCGFFGVKFRSDATSRFDALEDNQISADAASLIEVAGCEIQGSAATGMFFHGSREHYIEGNYVHHTYADHIHHTRGARESWIWGNYIQNGSPSRGDDGIACVTYGPNSARCGDMEWWENTHLGSGWGRGYAVIGGDNINIHDNWAIGVAGAGVIVASESSYNTSTSENIIIRDNFVYQCGHTIGHPGILISGASSAVGPIRNVSLSNNVSVGTPGGAYRAEGNYANVTNNGLKTQRGDLPQVPSASDVRMTDTTVLRTRDVSHVPQAQRSGLYRIHVRKAPRGEGFEQRFEYIVKGSESAVSAFVTARKAAGDYLSEQRAGQGGSVYALLLAREPLALPSGLSGVSFRELREKDLSGELSWLWQRVDAGDY